MNSSRLLSFYYQEFRKDSAYYFSEQVLALAQKLKSKIWEAEAYNQLGLAMTNLGNYPGALHVLLQARTFIEKGIIDSAYLYLERARAEENSADLETDLDTSLPKINIIPQDIGRVLLNLINNAFYAVHLKIQHAASLQQTQQEQQDYKPTVKVEFELRYCKGAWRGDQR
jgi:hypothetical protein